MARRVLAALVATTGTLLLGVPALAATTTGATISDLSVQSGAATFTVSVTLPPGATLDPARTTVTVAGQPVESRVTAAASSSSHARVAVLVVDTSGSMGPGGIAAARAAATAYAARVAGDVKVGLVSFADSPRLTTVPTTDRSALREGLGQLRSKGETALYDAVAVAVRAAGPGGAVVILSDGADTVSGASLADTLTRVRASGTRVSTVAFRTQDGVRGPLTQIARAGGGRVVAASGASDLAAAFAQAAAGLPAQLTLSATLPDPVPTAARLEVTVASSAASWTASAELPATPDAGPAPTADSGALPLPSASLVTPVAWYGSLGLVLAVVFAAALLLGWLLLPRPETAADRRQRALEVYSLSGQRARKASVDEPDTGTSAVVGLSQRFVDRRGLAESLSQQLERAGSRLRPAEWVVLRVCAVVTIVAVVTVLFGHLLIGLVAGIVGGWLVTHLWLRFRQARRSRAFSDALPETLQLVASSLRTGFSLPQALDAAQQSGVEPMAGELGRALAAARIGAPLEDELDLIADRTSSQDWRWAVMAVRIQRSVGGNLAEVLSTTVRTLRERAANRRLVRGLSAEGRLSAYILIGLPLAVAGLLVAFRRDYVRPLWTTTPGLVMCAGAVVLMAIGAWWMSKVVKVEV